MSSTRSRLLAAGAVGVILLAPLAGCGGDDKKPSSSSSAPAAPQSVDQDAFVAKVLAAIDAKKSVHMEIAGGSFLTATADMSFGEGEPASKISASIFGGQQVIIVSEGVVYLQPSPGAEFSVVEENTPTLGPLIGTFKSLGPRESVDGIQKGISAVTQDGPTTVDGAELNAYTVTVDTAKLTGALKLLAGTAGASAQLPMTFLLDGDDLVQQIKFDISAEPVTITFSDWDKPVTVDAPK